MDAKSHLYRQALAVMVALLLLGSLTACGAADTVSGKVSWDKTAIPGCTVSLSSGDDSASATIAEVQTDSGGKYEIEGVAPGKYLLVLNCKIEGYVCSGMDTVEVLEGKGTKNNIELAGWTALDNSPLYGGSAVVRLTRDGMEIAGYDPATGRGELPMQQPIALFYCTP